MQASSNLKECRRQAARPAPWEKAPRTSSEELAIVPVNAPLLGTLAGPARQARPSATMRRRARSVSRAIRVIVITRSLVAHWQAAGGLTGSDASGPGSKVINCKHKTQAGTPKSEDQRRPI